MAQRPTNPLTSRPDRGPSPRRGWWPPSRSPIKRWWGVMAHFMRFTTAAIVQTLSDPEGGLQRREAHRRQDVPAALLQETPSPRLDASPPATSQRPGRPCTARRRPRADLHHRTTDGRLQFNPRQRGSILLISLFSLFIY